MWKKSIFGRPKNLKVYIFRLRNHIAICFPPVPEILSKIQSDLSPLGYSVFFFFKGSLKIRNMSISSKLFGHCHLVPNFTPVPKILSKIQSDLSPLGYSVFFFCKGSVKIRNLSLSSKIFWHFHLVPNFTPVPEILSKIQSDPSSLSYSVFFSKGLGKYAIWVYLAKYLDMPFGSEFPPDSRDVIAICK